MAKKYEGGWGIRVRKSVDTDRVAVWLNGKGKLDIVDNAKRYKSRDEAYAVVNNDYGDNSWAIKKALCSLYIDANDLAVDKLPIVTTGYSVPATNFNPDRPWDFIFDRPVSPPYEPDESDYDDNCFPEAEQGFTYKEIDPKSKEGKKLIDMVCSLFGIKIKIKK